MAGMQGKRFLLRVWVGLKAVGFAAVCVGAGARAAGAQDTRTVTEPKIPKTCYVVFARQMTGNIHGDDFAAEELDTARIQQAIDMCAPNHSVELAAVAPQGPNDPILNAFVTGPLVLRNGVTLRVDQHVTLFGSRDPQVYEYPDPDAKPGAKPRKGGPPGKCGTREPRVLPGPTVSMSGVARPVALAGCRPLISASFVNNAGVMGEGTIDGRGYGKLFGKDYSWWQLARAAEPKDDRYYSVKLIVADHADGFTLYGIHLVNSPNYHVVVSHTNGFTAWGVHLQTPVIKEYIGKGDDEEDSKNDGPVDARNTDGIDPGTSENITIAHSWIDNGDDNVAIKQGVKHMSVLDNHFYNGHGMSIGSETTLGQSYLLVDGLTEDHTTSGIRIKSNVTRGGPVHDLTYQNVCMRDVAVPIAISPYYVNKTTEPFEDPKYQGFQIPDYKSITLKNIYAETPGDVLIAGLDDDHRTQISLDDVHIEGIQPSQVHLAYDDIERKSCEGHEWPVTNLPLTNVPASVKVSPLKEAGCGVYPVRPPDPCRDKFDAYR